MLIRSHTSAIPGSRRRTPQTTGGSGRNLATVYFWWGNIKGMHERATMPSHYVRHYSMVVIMIAGVLDADHARRSVPPMPIPSNLSFSGAPENALGWLQSLRWFVPDGERFKIADNAPSFIGLLGIMIAFGHSVLAMSGEETLAQVNRELEYPKLKNLKKAALVILVLLASVHIDRFVLRCRDYFRRYPPHIYHRISGPR